MTLSVTFFSLLVPLLLILLGSGQIALWWRWRQFSELLWLGTAFISIGFGVVSQVLWHPEALVFYVLGFTLFYVLGFSCVGAALASRMRVSYPWRVAMLISAACISLEVWFSAIDPNLPVRVWVVNAVSMLLAGLPLWYWQRMQLRNRFDGYLRWLYVVLIVLNTLRVVITMPFSKVGQTGLFTHTWFWLSFHAFFMVLGLLVAACMFSALFHDIVEQLKLDRNTDVLTQLPNRRGWLARLDQLQAQHTPEAAVQSALLLVDVDHFKQINDRFGHATGDVVLREVAQAIRQQVRGNDMVCRYGGEEFAVMLTDVNYAVAQQAAERIRQQIQSIRTLQAHGVVVTASIGVTMFEGLAQDKINAAFAVADSQMYRAKTAGRNQVVMG